MNALASVRVLLRVGLGGLLVLAGALKLRDPSRFAVEITNYHLLPDLAPYLAPTLPVVEVLTGLALVFAPARWRAAAALLALGLIAMFTVAVSSVLVRGINIDCGCFGGGEGPVGALTLARNAGLLVAAAGILLWERRGP